MPELIGEIDLRCIWLRIFVLSSTVPCLFQPKHGCQRVARWNPTSHIRKYYAWGFSGDYKPTWLQPDKLLRWISQSLTLYTWLSRRKWEHFKSGSNDQSSADWFKYTRRWRSNGTGHCYATGIDGGCRVDRVEAWE